MDQEADICIVGEGSYPYYAGGVAQWVHELITEHQDLTFHVITLVPPNPDLKFYYQFPKNVIGHSVYVVQDLPEGSFPPNLSSKDWEVLFPHLKVLLSLPSMKTLVPLSTYSKNQKKNLGKRILCESMETWNLFLKLYQEAGSFRSF